jgi:hypothetical protein
VYHLLAFADNAPLNLDFREKKEKNRNGSILTPADK